MEHSADETSVDIQSSYVYTCKRSRFKWHWRHEWQLRMNQHPTHTLWHNVLLNNRHTVYTDIDTHLSAYTQDPENHEHTWVSNNYKEENGVRASKDELPCSLSIKLPFFCLSSILFWSLFIDSNRSTLQQKILCLLFFYFLLPFLPSFMLFLLFQLNLLRDSFLLILLSCQGYTFVAAFTLHCTFKHV